MKILFFERTLLALDIIQYILYAMIAAWIIFGIYNHIKIGKK